MPETEPRTVPLVVRFVSTHLSRTRSGRGALRSISSKLSLQCGGEFGKDRKRSASRIPRTTATNQKHRTRKSMKNRNISSNPTAGIISRVSSQDFAACLSRPTPAAAATWCPVMALSQGTGGSVRHGSASLPPTGSTSDTRNNLGAFTGTADLSRAQRPRPDLWVKIIFLHWTFDCCGQRRRNLRHFRGVPVPDGKRPGVYDKP